MLVQENTKDQQPQKTHKTGNTILKKNTKNWQCQKAHKTSSTRKHKTNRGRTHRKLAILHQNAHKTQQQTHKTNSARTHKHTHTKLEILYQKAHKTDNTRKHAKTVITIFVCRAVQRW